VRALITGASGFAGSWLCRECAAGGDDVIGLSRRGTVPAGCGRGVALDLRDGAAVLDVVRAAAPDVVYHLAALTSVGRSWQEPARTLADNIGGSTSLLEAIRQAGATRGTGGTGETGWPRVVWVSSCEVYGQAPTLPASEQQPMRPANPYAVSKTTGEMLAGVYADTFGLDIVTARPFSHSGPGQQPIYLLSNLSRQAAEGRRVGRSALRIVTGNPDTRRDFTDVRDVVRAYRHLGIAPRAGSPGAPDRVYNVSSGVSVSAADQVALLSELVAPISVEHVVDPSLVRASEVMDLRGDHSRLTALTGWEPRIPLRQTMSDTIAFWEQHLDDPVT
jgi:GDP-4-dehydro-6-deoxy-D-mannose reductase